MTFIIFRHLRAFISLLGFTYFIHMQDFLNMNFFLALFFALCYLLQFPGLKYFREDSLNPLKCTSFYYLFIWTVKTSIRQWNIHGRHIFSADSFQITSQWSYKGLRNTANFSFSNFLSDFSYLSLRHHVLRWCFYWHYQASCIHHVPSLLLYEGNVQLFCSFFTMTNWFSPFYLKKNEFTFCSGGWA